MSEQKYWAEKCNCGHPSCSSGNLRPVTHMQGVMSMETAIELAAKLNAVDALVSALKHIDAIEPGSRGAYGKFIEAKRIANATLADLAAAHKA